jgi:hypothetical protein
MEVAQLAKMLTEAAERGPAGFRDLTAELVQTGGDERSIIIGQDGLTKYNVPMLPRPDAILRSSCTCNCVSEDAYAAGVNELAGFQKFAAGHLQLLSKAVDDSLADIRARVAKTWGLDAEACILAPSGTDAEYLPLLYAHLLAGEHGKVASIVTAAGEVGSGTAPAATGKVFAAIVPQRAHDLPEHGADNALVGARVFPAFPEVSEELVLLRDAKTGRLRDMADLDADVEAATARALETASTAVVHVVVASKTGQSIPSVAAVERLRLRFGPERIVAVADACQMRHVPDSAYARFVDLGFILLTTGSKFYAGPPFCSAVFFPPVLAADASERLRSPALAAAVANSSLDKYFNAGFVGSAFAPLKAALPTQPNLGLFLRWAMGAFEIERYHMIPETTRREIISEWADSVRELLRSALGGSPCIWACDEELRTVHLDEAVAEKEKGPESDTDSTRDTLSTRASDEPSEHGDGEIVSSIISFELFRRHAGGIYKQMGEAELKKVHTLMALDLTKQGNFTDHAGAVKALAAVAPGVSVAEVLAQPCYTAQPVKLGGGRVALRVAISAPMVTHLAAAETRAEAFAKVQVEDRLVFAKMTLLCEFWEALSA